MPHFSPIMWLLTGFLFYVVLFVFLSLFWWLQSYKFPKISIMSKEVCSSKWYWN
uniref:ATP synthase F0 subunit 8 n=1 Tax=Phyllodoce medipapillata TaxID=868040 RepID=UPI0030FE88A9